MLLFITGFIIYELNDPEIPLILTFPQKFPLNNFFIIFIDLNKISWGSFNFKNCL